MFVRLPQINRISGRLVALTLTLWLAGVGCVIGCEMNSPPPPVVESEAAVAAEDSCEAFSGHDCCRKSKDNGAAFVGTIPARKDDASCCPLAGQTADPARKASYLDAPLAVAGNGPLLTPNVRTSLTLPLMMPQIADRGSTYLRCCAFLI
jgi:hypothetical protein